MQHKLLCVHLAVTGSWRNVNEHTLNKWISLGGRDEMRGVEKEGICAVWMILVTFG